MSFQSNGQLHAARLQKSSRRHLEANHLDIITSVVARNVSVIQQVIQVYSTSILKEQLHDSMITGEMKVYDWMRRNPSAMHSHLGVNPITFRLMLRNLETLGQLEPTRFISTRIQLAIFLYMCRDGLGVCHAGEAFQRSNETILKWVHLQTYWK